MPELRITPEALRHDIAATKEAKEEEKERHRKRMEELDAHESWLRTALDLNITSATNGKAKHGKRKLRPGNKDDYRRYVLNALDRERARTYGEIAEIAGISYPSTHSYIAELVKDGEAKCVTPPGQRRNRKFVRSEVRLKPGQGVVGTTRKESVTNGAS